MFLDALRRRNPEFLKAVIALHQKGALPAGTFVIDLDAVQANTSALAAEARRLGLTALAMTKQFGRNPDVCRAITAGGIDASVAVDMAGARVTTRAGMRLGHVGHLVQVPAAEAAQASALLPDYWTVFSMEKAEEASAAAATGGRDQALLARVYAEGDEFYSGHEGGFPAGDIVSVAGRLDGLPGAHFAGITTFPALLYDPEARAIRPTSNLRTLQTAAEALGRAGHPSVQVNGPGTTSTVTLAALAEAGVTQVEPGHALTGTTPLHAVEENLPELPAMCYLSEVSHCYGGRAYCFGNGMYVDPVFPPYQIRAIVARGPDSQRVVDAILPPPAAIDYYGQLAQPGGDRIATGESVIFGFRAQAFVTRAFTAGVHGASSGTPRVAGLWAADGSPAVWGG